MKEPRRNFKPFSETINLVGQYPNSNLFKDTYTKSTEEERIGIIRLWMTEGIPYAFKNNPILYEDIRAFIARQISIHPKEVTLVGSARIGYSLSKKEWGNPFDNNSDFDFMVVSDDLFGKIVKEFQAWANDIASKRILPNTSNEMSYWLENIEYLDGKIPRGFIQIRFLPYNINYPSVKKCYDAIWLLKKRLDITATIPSVSDSSIRVYSSWKACIRQLHINFNSALNIRHT